MNDSKATVELQKLIDQVRHHLTKAQELMDSVIPNSVFGAHVQQLLDELHEQTMRDLDPPGRGDKPD